MRAETNLRTGRYREHRQALTRFSKNADLAPKYAFFAELVLLWLDSKPDQEDKIWSLMMFYISNKGPRNKQTVYDTREQIISPARDEWTRNALKEGLEVFLASENDDDDDDE